MWKNFGNTSTKIKMFVAIALLVGVGVTTYIAMGVDNGDGSGEPSLAVPDGDAGENNKSAKATESKAEPKGVTEKTEANAVQVTSTNSGGVTERMELAVDKSGNVQNAVHTVEVVVAKVEVEVPRSEVEAPAVAVEVSEPEVVEVEVSKAEAETPTAEAETPKNEVETPRIENGVVEEDEAVEPVVGNTEAPVQGSEEQNNNESQEEPSIANEESEEERLAREEAERLAELERQKELWQNPAVFIGVNTYPWSEQCPEQADTFITSWNGNNLGGYVCECVSYVAWKVYESYGIIVNWGHAKYWDDMARTMLYTVNNEPEAGAVGVENNSNYGHVFWVESVNSDGSIAMSDYNNWESSAVYSGTGHAHDYGAMTLSAERASHYSYIHFR